MNILDATPIRTGFQVYIVADSINLDGCRLTTIQATYPRIIHDEVLMHRDFSRSISSSRAIPLAQQIQDVVDEPYVPIVWGKNRKGMTAGSEMSDDDAWHAEQDWLAAAGDAIVSAKKLGARGLHRQHASRVLLPFVWTTACISGTNWSNFFHLRISEFAQPEFRLLAEMIYQAMQESTPVLLKPGEWHLPYITDIERNAWQPDMLRILSVARCARTSYLRANGEHDPQADRAVYDRLREGGHWNPFEHVAKARKGGGRIGNFNGFVQLRKLQPNEYVYDFQYPTELVS